MKYIYDLSLSELKDWAAEIGEKPFRAGQIFSALHNGVPVDEISNIPNTLKTKLRENFNCELPAVAAEQKSKDGTKKYLLQYADGDCVECVFLTQDYGNTICVSTQVGCRMGCVFCASGKDGLVRNLTAGEILAQVILVNRLNRDKSLAVATLPLGAFTLIPQGHPCGVQGKWSCCKTPKRGRLSDEKSRQAGGGVFSQAVGRADQLELNSLDGDRQPPQNAPTGPAVPHARAVTNIVLMGSGEPLDNFDAVMKFLELVTAADGINVSGRNISLSTSGLVPQIRRFADAGGQVNLCISLHAPNDELRRQIMPVAKRYGVRELVDSAKYFFERTHRRVIFEYSLMCRGGVPFNCTPEIGRELAALVRGFPAHINLINLNTLPATKEQAKAFITSDSGLSAERQRSKTDAVTFTPASKEQAKAFMDSIIKSGASCTMRKNRGDDIDGACGQLRTKFVGRPQ